jgi:signal transduction histidine kinase
MATDKIEGGEAQAQPRQKYAQALGFAFPFFFGMAILWLFLRADLDRQYDQVAQQASMQLNSLAETGASEIQSKILAVDLLLRDIRDRGISATDAEFRARTEIDLKQLGAFSSRLVARLHVVDTDGKARLGGPLPESEGKLLVSSGLLAGGPGNADRLVVEGGFRNGDFKRRIVLFARPILGPGSSVKGAVVLTADSRFLSTQKDLVPLTGGKTITVTNEAGAVLWASGGAVNASDSEAFGRELSEGRALVAAAAGALRSAKNGKVAAQVARQSNNKQSNEAIPGLIRMQSAADGRERVYAWRPATDYALSFFVGQPYAEAMQPYFTLRQRYLLFGLSISILFVASLYWFFAFRYAAEQSEIKQEAALELLRKSEKELSASRQSLRQLATHQMTLKEDERKRIALEIHDELGQRLTALRLEVAMAERRLATESDLSPMGALSNIKAQIDQVLEVVRNVTTRLRPATLDISLGSAVVGLLEEFRKMTGITVELSNQLPEGFHLGEPHNTAVFRILQESLTNVARHAQASKLDLSLGLQGANLVMEITDNGRGFNQGQSRDRASMGLSGMRERAMALGGSVEIQSSPAMGTKIGLVLPLPAAVESNLQFVSKENSLSDLRSE